MGRDANLGGSLAVVGPFDRFTPVPFPPSRVLMPFQFVKHVRV